MREKDARRAALAKRDATAAVIGAGDFIDSAIAKTNRDAGSTTPRVGRWFLGSMMVVACLSSTAGCAAYGQSVNVISTRETRSWPDSTVCSHQSVVQSTHEAGLDVVDQCQS